MSALFFFVTPGQTHLRRIKKKVALSSLDLTLCRMDGDVSLSTKKNRTKINKHKPMNRISEQYINSHLNTLKCGTRFTNTKSTTEEETEPPGNTLFK